MRTINLLTEKDIEEIAAAFIDLGWNKPASQYKAYLAEQERGERDVFVAKENSIFAGYVTVMWREDHGEIVDLNVLPKFRRRGIASDLMDAAEQLVSQKYDEVRLGVGLFQDYGAAQRMYVLRGYVPTGEGIIKDGQPLQYGQKITLDDYVTLSFTKKLVMNNDQNLFITHC